MMWDILLKEFLPNCRDDCVDLLQAMEPRLIPQRQGGVVGKMEVTRNLLKPLACYSGGDEGIV